MIYSEIYRPSYLAYNVSYCFVFDNDLGKWKTFSMLFHMEIVTTSYLILRYLHQRFISVSSDHVMHWICRDLDSKQGGILSFDVRTEIFSLLKFPSEVVHIWSSNLLEMEGLLWLVHPLKSPTNYR